MLLAIVVIEHFQNDCMIFNVRRIANKLFKVRFNTCLFLKIIKSIFYQFITVLVNNLVMNSVL